MRNLILMTMILSLGPLGAQEKAPSEPPVRGMTISCPGSGRLWGSDAMVETMRNLKAIGVNWITIHPYAGIRNNGRVSSRLAGAEEAPFWISRPIKEAHKLGLKVLIKPHIAYWGSKFRWRGEIDFADEKELARFFATYETWITSMARMSKGADAFVIGTELDRFVHLEEPWKKIIKSVRKQYSGPLTYAANWSDYERVSFWQDLDVIGIQAYFPLLTGSPDDGIAPTQKGIRQGWQEITRRMRAFSKSTGKKVCFTELGYNLSPMAPFQPWSYSTGGQESEALQKLCLKEALKAIASEPAIVGSFLWKCFPGRRQPRNFNMHTKAMRATIESEWKQKKSAQGS